MRRLVSLLLTVGFATLMLILGSPAIAAAEQPGANAAPAQLTAADDEITIRGTLRLPTSEPIVGAVIRVSADGKALGEAKSGADGSWSVKVPAAEKYSIELVPESLPAGVKLAENAKNPTERPAPTRGKFIVQAFSMDRGEAGEGGGVWGQIWQGLFLGLRFGLILALGALGLSMIYGTTGIANFAHGEMFALGAIMAYVFSMSIGMSIWLAIPLTLLFCAVVGGYLQDKLLWSPLRRRGTGTTAMMIVSIGLAFFVRYLYLFFFGGNTRNYDGLRFSPFTLGPLTINPRDLAIMLIAIIALAAAVIMLKGTRLGKATRAVSDNPALAASSGIDVDRIIQVVWIVGAVLAGLSGIMYGSIEGVIYDMGMGKGVLLLMFAAVVLGGLGTIWGAIVGSILVGIILELSPLVIPSAMKSVGPFAIMILVLLFMPTGLFGRRERIG